MIDGRSVTGAFPVRVAQRTFPRPAQDPAIEIARRRRFQTMIGKDTPVSAGALECATPQNPFFTPPQEFLREYRERRPGRSNPK